MKKAVYIIVCLLLTAVAAGCRTPKLSEADAQFQRGEYYDASVTYKKVYNKLRKRRSVRNAEKWRSRWDVAIGF